MTDSLNFGITGVAGYVAPRHLQAIKACGHELVAALDPNDSVGILDRYFPHARFFTEFERFDRPLYKLRRNQDRIDYLSICSPNYLHDAHIRAALRLGANAICEKPLVLNPWNLDALAEMERETGKQVYTVLQLRLHPAIQALRKKIKANQDKGNREIDLAYITSRGNWYHVSWKGSVPHSGGLASNIGIHFFDMLLWIFGKASVNEVHFNEPSKMAGYLELDQARVRWFLSVDENDLPQECQEKGQRTYRSITIDGEEIEFSGGFEDLHTELYRQTLAGEGFRIEENRPVTQLISDIRNLEPIGVQDHSHSFLIKASN